MTILYIFETDRVAAEALSHLDKPSIETVAHFDEDWPDMQSEITLLAHTDTERLTLGGRTPAELAKDFALKITLDERNALEHLYLISCEAGLARGQAPSLAEQLAIEMRNKGFVNLQVCAVTSPDDMPIAGMRVEVITQTGVSGKPKGYVQAFAYPTPYCETLENLSEEIHQRIEHLNQDNPDLSSGKKAMMAELKQKKVDLQTLNESLAKDPHFMKIDILATLRYKKELQQDYNRFVNGQCEKISFVALFTIGYLQTEKLKVALKPQYKQQEQHINLLNEYINIFQEKKTCSFDDAETILLFKKSSKKNTRPTFLPTEMITPLFDQFKKLVKTLEGLKDTTPELSPEIARIAARTNLCKQLTEYHELRSNEWDYHYNFLNLVSLVYLILDFCTGSDHFNSQKREVKLSATEKMIRHINGDSIQLMPNDEKVSGNQSSLFCKTKALPSANSENVFTKSELNALKQGRLGKMVAEHGGIDSLVQISPPPKQDRHKALHDRVRKYRP